MTASGKGKRQKKTAEEYRNLSKAEKKQYNRTKPKQLNKAISRQGFYDFKIKLNYKSKLVGKEMLQIDRFYASSKTCSKCGNIKKDLKLKDRVYKCESCGAVMDRDINAAINIRNKAVGTANSLDDKSDDKSNVKVPGCNGETITKNNSVKVRERLASDNDSMTKSKKHFTGDCSECTKKPNKYPNNSLKTKSLF